MTKIDRVEIVPGQLPLTTPITSALGRYTHVDLVIVRLRTIDGIVGTGFTACLGGAAATAVAAYIEHELRPLILDADVSDPDAVWHGLWSANKARLRGGIGTWGLSAVDVAVWDAAAQSAGQPLVTFLGGEPGAVPVYGSGGWHSLGDTELVAEAEAFHALGITAYKFKTGTERDAERTALLRETLGDDMTLLADANQRFTAAAAITHAAMLADHGVGWLEEPVVSGSLSQLRAVAAASAVPIATGENAYLQWEFEDIAACGVKYLQPDVGRVGGVTAFRRVAAIAEERGVALSSHLWHEISISVLGSSRAAYRCEYAELWPGDVLTRDFTVVDGCIRIPDVPGHGVEFSPAALEWFRGRAK